MRRPHAALRLRALAPRPARRHRARNVLVEDGTLDHSGEFCSCCNGEDGGSDENFGTFEEPTAVLVVESVADACVAGRYEAEDEVIAFVAERCDF
jgi:hypothetical protein